MKKHTIAVSLTQALLLSALSYSAWAAQVPPGTKLAEKQVIVINNGTEPVSLDPHKVEGVPESNIILNLLEGLVSTDGDGHIVPGWQRAGRPWITASGHSRCGRMLSGVTARR